MKNHSDMPIKIVFAWLLIAIQVWLLIAIIFDGLFGGVGFDHPGPRRLDLDTQIGRGFIYLMALGFGFAMTVSTKRYNLLVLQIIAAPCVFIAAIGTAAFRPTPSASGTTIAFTAEDFEAFIGKQKAEVHEILGHLKYGGSGPGGTDAFFEWERFGKYEVRYSEEGIVVSVKQLQ